MLVNELYTLQLYAILVNECVYFGGFSSQVGLPGRLFPGPPEGPNVASAKSNSIP